MNDLLHRASFKSLGATALVVMGLLVVGWAYLQGLAWAFDLNVADEGLYIQQATLWIDQHVPMVKEWGPLYHGWYGLLIRWSDPPTAFYWNLYLTFLVPPALLAGWIYRLTRQSLWSLLAGGWFLLSWGNHGDWRINHFLLGFVLIGFLLFPREPTPSQRVMWVTLQAWWAWLASYVRPEMVLTAGVLGLWGALEAVWGWRRYRDQRLWQGAVAGLFLLAVVLKATAAVGDPSGRMLGAFGQHFAVRWVQQTGETLNPYRDWPQILRDQFGPVYSVWEAGFRRPDLMVWFIGHNFLGWLLVVTQRLAPYPWRNLWVGWLGGLLVGTGVVFYGALRAKPRKAAPTSLSLKHLLPWLGVFVIWALPGMVASWIFYPRPHYQALPLALGWAALGSLAALAWPLPRRWDVIVSLLIVAGFVLGGPRPYRRPQPRPHLAAVCALRNHLPPTKTPLLLLEGPPSALLYLADKVQPYHDPAMFSATERPTLIFPWPLPDEARQKVPWLEELAADPESWGYTVARLPDGSRWLTRQPLRETLPTAPPWAGSVCSP